MSGEASDAALSTYFKEATSWDADRLAEARPSVVRAWRVATAASLCAVASALALFMIVPLHRIEPFLVRVDTSSGVVDVVPVYTGHTALPEAVTRYFLSHYVQTCERFNFATAETDYEECGAFHTAQRNQAWYALWNPSNASSPLNVHRDGSSVSVQIESLSFLKRASGMSDLAQVRYVRAERQGSGAPERNTHWIATVQYAYTAPSGDARVRAWNPLGFKVLEFLTEPEIQRESGASPAVVAGRSMPLSTPRVYRVSRGVGAVLVSLMVLGAARPDPRLRTVIYTADEIYRLVAYVGYQIDVEFEPGERFVGLGAGDVEGVTFAAQTNHLFLKPKAAGARTNLTVLTNRRSYHFDYTTSTGPPDPSGGDVLYVLRFLYADASILQSVRPADFAPPRIEAPAKQPHNSNYWYCGREELAPLAAWDDGVQTHLRFDARRELPAVFVRNDDGSESLLNFHIADGELIVHRLARHFIVRRGGLVGCIVNQGFAGSAEVPISGTVAPEIERRTREAPDAGTR